MVDQYPLTLPNQHPRHTLASIPGKTFDPNEISNLMFWHQIGEEVKLNGSDVAGIGGIEENKRIFGQTFAANQPAYELNGLNGYPVMDFDGASERLTLTPRQDFSWERTEPWTCICVCKPSAGNGNILNNFKVTGDQRGIWPMDITAANKLEILMVNDNSPLNAVRVEFGTLTVAPAQWYVLATQYDGSSSAAGMSAQIDGVDSPQSSVVSDNLSGTVVNANRWHIGALINGTLSFAGKMALLALYNRVLTQPELDRIYKFIHYRYGLL